MFYFREFELGENDQEKIEKRIRDISKRRHTSLDIVPSSSFAPDDKLFLAIERKDNFTLTRIRYFFGQFLPKIIVRFNKSNLHYYKIRLSLLSSIIFFFFCLIVFSWGLRFSQSPPSTGDFSVLFFTISVYLFLIIIEIAITKRKLKHLEK
jgi:hypothetical protein